MWQQNQQDNFALLNDQLSATAPCLIAGYVDTPIGEMLAVFSAQGLCLLEFVDQKNIAQELRVIVRYTQSRLCWDEHYSLLKSLQQQLDDYFSGSLNTFNIPLYPIGTPFQQQVWQVLCRIPYGQTMSYQQQAQCLGNIKAVRAVAAANGRNKISILIPCHRVIGSNGHLTGYAGGLLRKQALLNLEQTGCYK